MPAQSHLLSTLRKAWAYQRTSSACKCTITKSLFWEIRVDHFLKGMPMGKSAGSPRFLTIREGLCKYKCAYLEITNTSNQTPRSRVLTCIHASMPIYTQPPQSKTTATTTKSETFSFPSSFNFNPYQEQSTIMLPRFHFAPLRLSAYPWNSLHEAERSALV